ncbi:phage tail protein [Pseudomonas alkylphenolica]|uniref:Phage tail protein n=1 Tax=Pseudomonas alkylphenolica TaxID=237609 RepID=A0A443ZGX7_9PSED|nr:phage tail assembly chaperone [Pseudomonas alkylphenolica]RWU18112.1 phage tail protein [Pseudomonas alkylphenolica]
MTVLFSPSRCRFYLRALANQDTPTDVIEITAEQHLELVNGQASGLHLSADADGNPILIEQPKPPLEVLAATERAWRDAQISSTEWLTTRHRDEQDMQQATTLTAEQFSELLAYRQHLRDWPETEAFPDSLLRPVEPDWIAEQTQ